MRRFVVAVLFLLGALFVITQFASLRNVLEVMRRGDPRWLLLALFVQWVWLLNLAVTMRAVYRTLGMESGLDRLMLLTLAATGVNIAAPSAGLGGMALFIVDARRRGQSSAKATLAGVLYVLMDYASFIAVLALGLIVLVRRGGLSASEVAASSVLVAIALGLSTLLYLGYRSESELEWALVAAVRAINRIARPVLRRDHVHEANARAFAHDVSEGLSTLRSGPRQLLLPAALALSGKALMISLLFMMFAAFQQAFSLGTLVAGYSIGQLFLIVSPTPSGIGFVESAMTLGLRGLRVPLESAAVITMAYRGFTFWLPVVYGLAAMRVLDRRISVDALSERD